MNPSLRFAACSAALSDRPWTVVQDLLVQNPDRVGTREIDFLVIDPTRGMLVIEVKGGDYRFDATNGWHRRVGHQVRPRWTRRAQAGDRRDVCARQCARVAGAPRQGASAVSPPAGSSRHPDIEIRADSLPPDAQGHVLDSRVTNDPARLLADIEDLFDALAARIPRSRAAPIRAFLSWSRVSIVPETRTRLGVRNEIRQARAIETDSLRPVRAIVDAAHEIDRLHVRGFPEPERPTRRFAARPTITRTVCARSYFVTTFHLRRR
jgi:hypothetical protein